MSSSYRDGRGSSRRDERDSRDRFDDTRGGRAGSSSRGYDSDDRRRRDDRERDSRGEGSRHGGGWAREGSDRESTRRRRRSYSRSRSRSPPRRQRDRDDNDVGRRRNSDDRRERSREIASPAAVSDRNANAGRSKAPLPSQNAALADAGVPASSAARYGKKGDSGKDGRGGSPSAEAIAASKPNFGNSGLLAAETNTTLQGVVLKYNEPPEARKPNKGWRLYVFKGKEQVDMVQVNRQSAYLFGRDRVVADIPLDHPSASKQHAVLQFRQAQERSEFGETKTLTKPYIIDLDSANGTSVNDEKIPASRYYELKPSDVLKFAFSTREYVVIVD